MSVMASTKIEKQVFVPSAIREKVNFGDQVYLAHNGRHTTNKVAAESAEAKVEEQKVNICCRCQRSGYEKCVRGRLSSVKLPQQAIDSGCANEYDLCMACVQLVLLKSSGKRSDLRDRSDQSTGKVVKTGYAANARKSASTATFVDFRTGPRTQPRILIDSSTKLNWKLPPLIMSSQHPPKPFSLSQSTLSSLPISSSS